jgi:hypothetical protein
MSAHILNIFIEKRNRARGVRVSPHKSRTVKVLRTILVLSSAHASVPATLYFTRHTVENFLLPNFICDLYKYNQQVVKVHITYTEARREGLSSAPL